MSKWFVICTRKGWEKKVEQLLLQKGFESYCPLVEEKRKWSDRVKLVAAPLLGSHVFVKITEEQRSAVRRISGVKNFVYANGKPATVRRKEVELLQQMLAGRDVVKVICVTSANPLLAKNGVPAPEKKAPGQRIRKTIIQLGENGYEVWASVKPALISEPIANGL